MHPVVVAIWMKTNGQGHLCTLDTYLHKYLFTQQIHNVVTTSLQCRCNVTTMFAGLVVNI